jgi:hypothetical protein
MMGVGCSDMYYEGNRQHLKIRTTGDEDAEGSEVAAEVEKTGE